MLIKESLQEIDNYVREGEIAGYPYLLIDEEKIKLALFTYLAYEDEGIKVFGFGQEIIFDGNTIEINEKELFGSADEIIAVRDYSVSVEEYDNLFSSYCNELQYFIDSYKENGKTDNVEKLKEAFLKIIPDGALELYRRGCNEFLKILSIN